MPRKKPVVPQRKAGRARDGDGWVKELSPGVWRGAVSVKLADGTSKRLWLRGATQDEVLLAIAQRRVESARGTLTVTPATTVGAYLAQWLTDQEPTLRPQSIATYRQHVRRITDSIGGYQLGKLGPEHVKRLHTQLLARGLSVTTVRATHGLLSQALEQAVAWDRLSRNVARAAKAPRAAPPEVRPLTVAEARTILSYAEAHPDRLTALWVVLMTTGIRLGEALGLHWADLDLERQTLSVRHQLTAAGRQIAEPKSRSALRTLPLIPRAVAALRQHRTQQLAERLATGLHPEWDAVFCSLRGEPYYQQTVREHWRRLLDAAGVRQVVVHDLRHGYVTGLADRGVAPRDAQAMAGHANLAMTLGRYTHVGADVQDRIRGQVDALFGSIVASIVASEVESG